MKKPADIIVKIAYIKESYFQKFATQDNNIKLNHAADRNGSHDRPHLMLQMDKNKQIFLCVPFSTQVIKAMGHAKQKTEDANAMHLKIPTNYGAAFLMFNGKQNVALVSQIIPVTQSYIKNVVENLIDASSYDKIVDYVKDNLKYYYNHEKNGYGWRGVITQYNEIRRQLERELNMNAKKSAVRIPAGQSLFNDSQSQNKMNARLQQSLEERSINTRDAYFINAKSLKAEIGDVRSQLNLESASHDDMER